MFGKLKNQFSALTLIKKVGVALASIFVVGVVATAASGNTPQKEPITDTQGVTTATPAVTSTPIVTPTPIATPKPISTPTPTPTPTPISTPVPLHCPNGTYVNSAGNTVCSPYSSPSAPEGATAQCRDGTYSFSQSRSGTCSHHGGVSTWL